MKIKLNSQARDLLEKYTLGIITLEEFDNLRNIINNYNDEQLKIVFDAAWEESKEIQSIDPIIKKRLFSNIQEQIEAHSKQDSKIFRKNRFLQFASSIAITIIFVLVSWNLWNLHSKNTELVAIGEKSVVVKVGKGERVSINLPDGTNVRLNSESELSYQQNFGLKDRVVQLKGEGYFDVTRNTEKPFHVGIENLNIEVLGTQFNVYAYDNTDSFEITLITGKVKVETAEIPHRTLEIKKNEKVIYNKITKEMRLEKTSNFIERAWVSNELVFRSSRLREVFDAIGRKYGFKFDIKSTNILDEEYTGVFDDANINEVMNVLKEHFNFQYRIKEHDIYVY